MRDLPPPQPHPPAAPDSGHTPSLFARAPGPVLYGLAVVSAATLLVRDTDPAGSELDGFIALILFICLAAWVVRLIGFLSRLRKRRTASRGVWFAAGPIVLVMFIALARAQAPMRLRWSWSRSAFQRAVQSAPPAPAAHHDPIRFAVPRHLGWYDVAEAERYPWGVVFRDAGGDVAHSGGFAYIPGGLQTAGKDWSPLGSTSLGGGWYSWSSGF